METGESKINIRSSRSIGFWGEGMARVRNSPETSDYLARLRWRSMAFKERSRRISFIILLKDVLADFRERERKGEGRER